MNEYTSTLPFDLFSLHLLHLVAQEGSFTKAAGMVGLTQSAMTRQIQGMENRIGLPLLERTTRQVSLTPAGELLLRETRHIIGDIASALRRLQEELANTPKEIRVGVSQTIGLAYLPGFFFSSQRKFPEVGIKVRHESSQTILASLEAGTLDVGIISLPENIPPSLKITYRFEDSFTLIVPAKMPEHHGKNLWEKWLNSQNWLHLHAQSNTGKRLREWIVQQGGQVTASSETDNFDLIIHLVALGLGVSLVPQRALASYPRKKAIRQIILPQRFTRELVVLIRRTARPVPHVEAFVENILF